MKKISVIFTLTFLILLGGEMAVSAGQERREELFYNPIFSQILDLEKEISEYLPFVMNNFFILDGVNNRDKVDYGNKIELSGKEILEIEKRLEKIKLITGECQDFLDKQKDIFPLSREKREKICDYIDGRLKRCLKLELEICGNRELGVEGILFKNFTPLSNFEERRDKDKHSPEFFRYMRGLRSWFRKFEDSLLDVNKKFYYHYCAEITLDILEYWGFTLKGNTDSSGKFTPYFNKVAETKNFHFIKADRSGPLSKEEMKALNPQDPDSLDKIYWRAFIPEGTNIYIGIVFRDNPSIDGHLAEVMEFYNMGFVQDPSNLLELAIEKMPLEIRWVDRQGKPSVMWSPIMFCPLDYLPTSKGELE